MKQILLLLLIHTWPNAVQLFTICAISVSDVMCLCKPYVLPNTFYFYFYFISFANIMLIHSVNQTK